MAQPVQSVGDVEDEFAAAEARVAATEERIARLEGLLAASAER